MPPSLSGGETKASLSDSPSGNCQIGQNTQIWENSVCIAPCSLAPRVSRNVSHLPKATSKLRNGRWSTSRKKHLQLSPTSNFSSLFSSLSTPLVGRRFLLDSRVFQRLLLLVLAPYDYFSKRANFWNSLTYCLSWHPQKHTPFDHKFLGIYPTCGHGKKMFAWSH